MRAFLRTHCSLERSRAAATKILLLVFLSITASIGFYQLTESPKTWYDEGLYLQVARTVAHHHGFFIQIAPHEFTPIGEFITVGYPVTFPLAMVLRVFGDQLLYARVFAVMYLLLFVGVSTLYVKHVFGTRLAWYTLPILTTFAPLYGNGKEVLGEVPGLFFLVAFFLTLQYLVEKQKRPPLWLILTAGLSAGLAIATKPNFIVLLPAMLVGGWFYRKELAHLLQRCRVCVFLFGLLTPLLALLLSQFHASERPIDVLRYILNPYGLTNLAQVMAQNALRFTNESTPLYFMGMLVIWISALVIRRARQQKIVLTELIALFFTLATLYSYLRSPGWYRYFFLGNIVAILFFVPAFFLIVESIQAKVRPVIAKGLFFLSRGVLVALVCFQLYQVGFHSWVADYYNNTQTQELSDYFTHIFPKEQSIFLYQVPEVALFLPTDLFYQAFTVNNPRLQLVGADQRERLKEGIPDQVITSADALPALLPFLERYVTSTTIVHGNYVLFVRK
ncbi:glycosyltransferase family 39 protein [Patescibacteria group bacterium]|nr:glycosyltransferase family 39 protein [Patescibacteria group bacterium]